MAGRRIVDIARDVVADLDPDELADFDLVAEAFAADPRAAGRAPRPLDEPTASGTLSAGEVLASFVLAVGVDLSKDLIVNGVRHGVRSASSWWRNRGKKVTIEDVPPPIPEDAIDTVEAQLVELGIARGGSPELARSMARAMVTRWNRR